MTLYRCRRHTHLIRQMVTMKTSEPLVFFQLLISLQLLEGIQRVACQLSVSGLEFFHVNIF